MVDDDAWLRLVVRESHRAGLGSDVRAMFGERVVEVRIESPTATNSHDVSGRHGRSPSELLDDYLASQSVDDARVEAFVRSAARSGHRRLGGGQSQMRPLRLELQGFSAFRDLTVIDFSDIELVALVGPTGSGKSSIIDAMTFALYGSAARYDERLSRPSHKSAVD